MAFGPNGGVAAGQFGQGLERGVGGLVQQLQQQQERDRLEANRREDIERTTQFRNEDRATQQMRWDTEDKRYAEGLIREDVYRAMLVKREDEKNALEEKWRQFNSDRDESRWQTGLLEKAEDKELRASGMSYDRLLAAWDRIPSAADDEKNLFEDNGAPKTGAALADAIKRLEKNEARRANIGAGLGKSLKTMNPDLDVSRMDFGGYVGEGAATRLTEARSRVTAAAELGDLRAQRKELQDRWNDPARTDKNSPEGEQLWAEITALDDQILERNKVVYGNQYSVRNVAPDKSDPDALGRARTADVATRAALEPLRLGDPSGTIARFLAANEKTRLNGTELIDGVPIQQFLADYARNGGLENLLNGDAKARAQAFTIISGLTDDQLSDLPEAVQQRARDMLNVFRNFDPSDPDAITGLPAQYRSLAENLSMSWLEVKGRALQNEGTAESTAYTRTLKNIAEVRDVREGVSFLNDMAKDGNTAALGLQYNGFVALAKKNGWDDDRIASEWAKLTTRAIDTNTERHNRLKAQVQELQQGALNLEQGRQALKTGDIRNMAMVGEMIKSGALWVLSDSNQDAWLRSILPPESANATITAWRAEAKINFDAASTDGKDRARLLAAQVTSAEVDARVSTATENMRVEDFENKLKLFTIQERSAVNQLFAAGAEQFGVRWLNDPKTIELAQQYKLNLNPLRETQAWRDLVLKSNAAVAGTEADNAARNQAYKELSTLASTPTLALSSAKRVIELGKVLGIDGNAFLTRIRQDVILGRTRDAAQLDALLASTAQTKQSTTLDKLRYNYMVMSGDREWNQSLIAYGDSRKDAEFNQWLSKASFENTVQQQRWTRSFTIETDARDSALAALRLTHEISTGNRQLDQGARSLLSTELTAISNQAVNVRAEIGTAEQALAEALKVPRIDAYLGPQFVDQITDVNGVTTWKLREGVELGDMANAVNTAIAENNKVAIGRWNLANLNNSNNVIIDRLRSLGPEGNTFADELGDRTGNTGDGNYVVAPLAGAKIMESVQARIKTMSPANQQYFAPILKLIGSNAEGYIDTDGYCTAFAAQVTADILRLPKNSLRGGELFGRSATETVANFKGKNALTAYTPNTQLKDGQLIFLQYKNKDGTLGDPSRDHVGVYFGGYIIQNSQFRDNKINGAIGYMSSEEYLKYGERNGLSITVGTVTPQMLGVKPESVTARISAEPKVIVAPGGRDPGRTGTNAGPTTGNNAAPGGRTAPATTPRPTTPAPTAPNPQQQGYVMPKFGAVPKQFGQASTYRGEALGIPASTPGEHFVIRAVTPEAVKYSQTAYGAFIATYKNSPGFSKLTVEEKIPRLAAYLTSRVGYTGTKDALNELARKLITGK